MNAILPRSMQPDKMCMTPDKEYAQLYLRRIGYGWPWLHKNTRPVRSTEHKRVAIEVIQSCVIISKVERDNSWLAESTDDCDCDECKSQRAIKIEALCERVSGEVKA